MGSFLVNGNERTNERTYDHLPSLPLSPPLNFTQISSSCASPVIIFCVSLGGGDGPGSRFALSICRSRFSRWRSHTDTADRSCNKLCGPFLRSFYSPHSPLPHQPHPPQNVYKSRWVWNCMPRIDLTPHPSPTRAFPRAYLLTTPSSPPLPALLLACRHSPANLFLFLPLVTHLKSVANFPLRRRIPGSRLDRTRVRLRVNKNTRNMCKEEWYVHLRPSFITRS